MVHAEALGLSARTVRGAAGACQANAAATSGSGDNDGFETNPQNACTDDSTFALDTNSGTSTSCASTDKDRHEFYDYNFTIAAGSTIDGVEVRLDAKVNGTTGGPEMCVELS